MKIRNFEYYSKLIIMGSLFPMIFGPFLSYDICVRVTLRIIILQQTLERRFVIPNVYRFVAPLRIDHIRHKCLYVYMRHKEKQTVIKFVCLEYLNSEKYGVGLHPSFFRFHPSIEPKE